MSVTWFTCFNFLPWRTMRSCWLLSPHLVPYSSFLLRLKRSLHVRKSSSPALNDLYRTFQQHGEVHTRRRLRCEMNKITEYFMPSLPKFCSSRCGQSCCYSLNISVMNSDARNQLTSAALNPGSPPQTPSAAVWRADPSADTMLTMCGSSVGRAHQQLCSLQPLNRFFLSRCDVLKVLVTHILSVLLMSFWISLHECMNILFSFNKLSIKLSSTDLHAKW